MSDYDNNAHPPGQYSRFIKDPDQQYAGWVIGDRCPYCGFGELTKKSYRKLTCNHCGWFVAKNDNMSQSKKLNQSYYDPDITDDLYYYEYEDEDLPPGALPADEDDDDDDDNSNNNLFGGGNLLLLGLLFLFLGGGGGWLMGRNSSDDDDNSSDDEITINIEDNNDDDQYRPTGDYTYV